MSTPPRAEKIATRHRERRAYVYVRQSSPKQVRENAAGRENQYALVERARALGWPPERIQLVDDDLGQSGQDGQRPGFQELVGAVSLGRVGLILAYEASRLARSNADWYTLLDLATIHDALIADTEGVYDPRDYNDRLLLGLRGMLSEAELHLLRLRMDAGRLRQVEAGTYRQHLPTGLARLEDGRVVKDPDEQVQRAIALVFERFAALGTCQRVLRALRDAAVLLPRRQRAGLHAGQLLWRRPSAHAIYEILHNPAYAGAFVYGRHAPAPDRRPGQRGRLVNRPFEEWTVIRQDVYPSYISWEQYMANRARLADNRSSFAQRARGAPRWGTALLTGLAVCGRCGRQMRTVYKPRVRYTCQALTHTYAARQCLHLDGAGIEAAVVAAFFAALAPAELDVLDDVLAAQAAERARLAQQHADQVARAEYEARLAQKQYHAVDPENRLVAAELERRWELALRAVAEAREAAATFAATPPAPALDPILREQLRDVGRHLPAWWASGRLRPEQQKALLRTLIRRVVLTRPAPDLVEVKVVWVSGAVTPLTVRPPIHREQDVTGYAQLVERALALSAAGHTDGAVARQLAAAGFHSARCAGVSEKQVLKIRRAAAQRTVLAQFRGVERFDGRLTVLGLARRLGVERTWVYRRIADGTIPAERHPVTANYLIADDPALVERLATTLRRTRNVPS
ncbi:MAG TPA: recombinase family protein [Thermomicrobiales bacterium]|nr:recombinase family protein [Thermomicrobiales bacterium]